MASMKALKARPNSAAVSSWSGMSHPFGTWCRSSQSRVHRLALQSEHAEDAFVHTPKRLLRHEPLQRLQPQRELARGQRPLGAHAAGPQPLQVLSRGVLRAIDDPQVLPPAALQRGLNETPLRVARHEVARLDDHAVAAAPVQLLPPGDAVRNA